MFALVCPLQMVMSQVEHANLHFGHSHYHGTDSSHHEEQAPEGSSKNLPGFDHSHAQVFFQAMTAPSFSPVPGAWESCPRQDERQDPTRACIDPPPKSRS